MSKVDTQDWKSFRLGDLFDVEYKGNRQQVPTGGMISKSLLLNGDTPRVTVSNVDNGIIGYYADVDSVNYRVYENFISVSFLGTVFYQKKRTSLDMKVHCLHLSAFPMNENIGHFLVTVIRKAISGYTYASQLSSSVLPDVVIFLPATSDGQPDWDYMDTYMGKVLKKEEVFAEHLASLTVETVADGDRLDIRGWKAFRIGELFEIRKGRRLTKAAQIEGDTAFIGATMFNNGVTAFIGNNEHVFPGHCLSVCYNGAVGVTFFQKDDFWASDDVNALYSKTVVSDLCLMFMAPLIEQVGKQNFAYVDKWTQEVMEASEIYLPVMPDGQPDWVWMEQYMQQQMDKAAILAEYLKILYNDNL